MIKTFLFHTYCIENHNYKYISSMVLSVTGITRSRTAEFKRRRPARLQTSWDSGVRTKHSNYCFLYILECSLRTTTHSDSFNLYKDGSEVESKHRLNHHARHVESVTIWNLADGEQATPPIYIIYIYSNWKNRKMYR